MGRQKIILDCDPGHDDAVAIMMAGRCPGLEILGITVVAGNQALEKTTVNTLNICQYLELDVPVFAGCGQPMVVRRRTADDIAGESGLDGHDFGTLKKPLEKKHGMNFIIDTLMASDGDIVVVTTGPMTNLAMAMRLEPRIVPKIKEIVSMGGTYQLGNITPAAEFNIIADAEAAHVVFQAGRPLTMIGLDVTRKVRCLPEIVEKIGAIGNPAAELFRDLMHFLNQRQREVFGLESGPLHDPVTVAYLIDPTLVTVKEMYTEIDIRSVQSYGRTNCDFFGYSKKKPNVKVGIDIDVNRFWELLEREIHRYDSLVSGK